MTLNNRRNEEFLKTCKDAKIEKLELSKSNKKLVPNLDTSFLIWNIPAIKTCPYATEHCKALCYARKAEQAYPDCLPSRERHFKESMKEDFITRMLYTILSYRKNCRGKKLVVRIHESGDFYNQAYTNKWLEIIDRCKGENIQFIAYTKSYPYFNGKALPENLSLRFSIWDDTTKKAIDTCKRNRWNIYTAVESFSENDTFTQCRCKDCASCGFCWNNLYKDIRCEIH